MLYKIQQYVTYSKADWENYERNKQLLAENPVPASQITDVAQAVQQDDIYPVDTNFATPAVKAQEMERIKRLSSKIWLLQKLNRMMKMHRQHS